MLRRKEDLKEWQKEIMEADSKQVEEVVEEVPVVEEKPVEKPKKAPAKKKAVKKVAAE